jgi:hypothetical protein
LAEDIMISASAKPVRWGGVALNARTSQDFVVREEVAYGAILGTTAVGGFLVWLGIQALDPAWSVGKISAHGIFRLGKDLLRWLGDTVSPTARGCIVIAIGVVALVLAILMVLDALLWRKTVLIVDADGIEGASDEGTTRLAWKDITAVYEDDQTLLICDRDPDPAISIGTDELDKTVKQIYAAIARYRPEVLPGHDRTAGAR